MNDQGLFHTYAAAQLNDHALGRKVGVTTDQFRVVGVLMGIRHEYEIDPEHDELPPYAVTTLMIIGLSNLLIPATTIVSVFD